MHIWVSQIKAVTFGERKAESLENYTVHVG